MEYTQGRRKEIQEAIQAGNDALAALCEAEQHLSSARGFGIWDMLGGGFISSMMKHSRMDAAQKSVNDAQYALQRFSRELEDVQMHGTVQINFSGFVQFIDVFCDNFLVDIMVQSKIRQTQESIAEIKGQIQRILTRLMQEL